MSLSEEWFRKKVVSPWNCVQCGASVSSETQNIMLSILPHQCSAAVISLPIMWLHCICCFSLEQRSFCPIPRHPCGFNQFKGEAVKTLQCSWVQTISTNANGAGHIRKFSTTPRTNRLNQDVRNASSCSKAVFVAAHYSTVLLKEELFIQFATHSLFKLKGDNLTVWLQKSPK